MGIRQWLSDLFFGTKTPDKKKTESRINMDNWLDKAAKIVDDMEAADKAAESEESKARQVMASILLRFNESPEGQAAAILLNVTKERVFLIDGKPAILNFFYYGPRGFENGLEKDGKSYEIDAWSLVNFLYLIHEARLAVSASKPTVESARLFSFGLIDRIRKVVNAIAA